MSALPDMEAEEDVRESQSAEAELIAIAQRILNFKEGHGLSWKKFIRQYPGIGSDRTISALAKGETSGRNVINLLPAYRAVEDQINDKKLAEAQEELYSDLGPAQAGLAAARALIHQQSLQRFVLIEGPSGSGKSKTLDLIQDNLPGSCIRLNLTEACESRNHLAGVLLCAVRKFCRVKAEWADLPPSYSGRERELLERLADRKVFLLIDEGHHMRAPGLNLLKAMINETPARIVLATIDTLWNHISRKYLDEALQLIRNRLHKRITLAPPSTADIDKYIRRRTGIQLDPQSKKSVYQKARSSGRFAFLRRICEELETSRRGEEDGRELTPQDVLEATQAALVSMEGGVG